MSLSKVLIIKKTLQGSRVSLAIKIKKSIKSSLAYTLKKSSFGFKYLIVVHFLPRMYLVEYLIIRAMLECKKMVFFQARVIFRHTEKPFATCNCHYPLAAFLYCPGALHNATFSRNLCRNDFSFKYWRIRFDLK